MYNVSTIQKQFTAEIKEKDTEIRILNEKVTRLEKNLESMESKLDENEVSETWYRNNYFWAEYSSMYFGSKLY